MRAERWAWPLEYLLWIDLAWVGFAVANLVAMALLPTWETVPFHFIWVSLTLLYGYRVWDSQRTGWVLVAVVVSTGAVLEREVAQSFQPADELTEVPLMAAMFLAMVWHARRRLVSVEHERQASDANRRVLERQRQFVQDASHELRTPITIALGHAELVVRGCRDPELAEDARIVLDELLRLRQLADRLLLLATAEDAGPVVKSPVEAGALVTEALQRWSATPRRWRLERADQATVLADRERLAIALDALVENAVERTGEADEIRLGAWHRGDHLAITVVDSGPGIAPEKLEQIFDRFARLDEGRSRNGGGAGLGLPIVRAIVRAHGGHVRADSTVGLGSSFEIALPLEPVAPSGEPWRPLPVP